MPSRRFSCYRRSEIGSIKPVLADLLRRERAVAAYEVLRAFTDMPEVTVTDEAHIETREQLRRRPSELRHQGTDATLQKKPTRRRGPPQ
jgi:hypothetical protein